LVLQLLQPVLHVACCLLCHCVPLPHATQLCKVLCLLLQLRLRLLQLL
jgi:hypothetical protein